MIFRFLLTLLLLVSVSSFPPCKEAYYDYQQLALTWPNQYCSEHQCVSSWQNKWDGESMIIHGFWPSSTDLSYLSCSIKNGYDPYCNHAYKFSMSAFSRNEKKDLNKYWPQIGQIKNFWAYQWNKHGTCYLHLVKDEEKSQKSQREIFKEYFMSTVDKVKGLNIKLSKGKVQTKTELASKIGLHASEFYAICGRDNELDEIRICYDIYYIPGLEEVMKCPSSSDRNQCKFPAYIK